MQASTSGANRAVLVAALLGLAAAWNAGNVGPIVASIRDDLTLLFIATLGVPLIIGAWLVHYLTEDGGIGIGIAVAGALSILLFGVSAAMRVAGARMLARGGSPVVLGASRR